MDLLTDFLAIVAEQPAKVLWAVLGLGVVLLPLSLGAVAIDMVLMATGMAAGLAVDSEAMVVVGMLVGAAIGVALLLVVIPVVAAPIQASLIRALATHYSDPEGSDLGFGSPFRTPAERVGVVIRYALFQGIVVCAGLLMLYIPGLLLSFFLGFGLCFVVLRGMAPMDASRASFAHVQHHLAWHVGFFAILLAGTMILSNIPLVGAALSPGFALAWTVFVFERVIP